MTSKETAEKFYRSAEAAQMLHISTATLRAWAAAGKIAQTKTAGGHRRYSAQAIEDARAMVESEQRSLMRAGQDAARSRRLSTPPGRLMPGEGVTYLVDHYAVMGIDRSATAEQITQAWRRANKDYHPDRYAHLAPDMQRQAAEKNLRIRRSYDVLRDAQAKAAYDQQLASWEGPLSKDGLEIIVVGAAGIIGRHAFGEESWREFQKRRQMTLAAIGYDETVYKMLSDRVRAADETDADLPENIRQAWSDTLARRDQYLALQIGFALDDLGDSEAAGNSVNAQYPALMQTRVEQAAKKLRPMLAKQLPVLAEQRLLEAGSDAQDPTTSTELVLVKMHTEADEQIRAAIQTILDAAAERAALADQRLDVIAPTYQPTEQPATQKIALELTIYGKIQKIAFVMHGDDASQDEPLTAQIQSIDFDDLTACQQLIEQGVSVLRYAHQEGLDIMEEMASVLGVHAERLAQAQLAVSQGVESSALVEPGESALSF